MKTHGIWKSRDEFFWDDASPPICVLEFYDDKSWMHKWFKGYGAGLQLTNVLRKTIAAEKIQFDEPRA